VSQGFHSHLSPTLEVRQWDRKGGAGIFAREPVSKEEILLVCGGSIVTGKELATLPAVTRRHGIQIEDDLYVVTIGVVEPADCINHSCDPNAGLRGQIVMVAMRDIEPGEEICFDYAMSDSSSYDEFDCGCGTRLCRKRVTGADWMLPELWDRYEGHFSPYLERRIAELKRKKNQTTDEHR
jgi:hypothetical protein